VIDRLFLLLFAASWAVVAQAADFAVRESFQVGQGVVVRALAVDGPRQRLWVGTSVGAMQVDLRTGERLGVFTRDNALANEYVFAAFVDSRGMVWLGTNGGGVSRYAAGARTASTPIWRSCAVDPDGVLWVGTEGGLNAFDGRAWHTWTHADGLGAPNRDGRPFSDNTGLGTRNRHDLNVRVDGRPSYNPNYVFSLAVDRDGHVWVGTWGGGVSRFDGRRFHNETRAHGLPGEIVYALAVDADGRLWAGTDGGLAYREGGRWHAVPGLPPRDVYALAAAPDGSVWAGLNGLVARIGR